MIGAINSIGAVNATTTVAKTNVTQKTGGEDFTKVLADMASGAVDALKGGEAAAIGGIQGTRTVQDVVQSVMNAEQALQTAIAVRDKLIAAYTEISRMAI
jgi:flagellar hook-basal body complex protein FliE